MGNVFSKGRFITKTFCSNFLIAESIDINLINFYKYFCSIVASTVCSFLYRFALSICYQYKNQKRVG